MTVLDYLIFAALFILAAGWFIERRKRKEAEMATPASLIETFNRVKAEMKAAAERDKQAAVDMAVASLRAEIEREFDEVQTHMDKPDFPVSGH